MRAPSDWIKCVNEWYPGLYLTSPGILTQPVFCGVFTEMLWWKCKCHILLSPPLNWCFYRCVFIQMWHKRYIWLNRKLQRLWWAYFFSFCEIKKKNRPLQFPLMLSSRINNTQTNFFAKFNFTQQLDDFAPLDMSHLNSFYVICLHDDGNKNHTEDKVKSWTQKRTVPLHQR